MYSKRRKYKIPPRSAVKSVRELADQIGVSPKTIWRAYAEGRDYVYVPAPANWLQDDALRKFIEHYRSRRDSYVAYVRGFIGNLIDAEQVVDDAFLYVCIYAENTKNLPAFWLKVIQSMTNDKRKQLTPKFINHEKESQCN